MVKRVAYRVGSGQYLASGVLPLPLLLQTFLTFAPDGCEYGEAEPVLLCDGCMRNTAGVAGASGRRAWQGGAVMCGAGARCSHQ